MNNNFNLDVADPRMNAALDRCRVNKLLPGDAEFLSLWADEWCAHHNELMSYLELLVEITPGTFESLSELALAERF